MSVYRKARKASRKGIRKATTKATRVVTNGEDPAALAEWIDANDPLYDRSGAPPITVSELFSTKLIHKTFTKQGLGETPYDWSKFRGILEQRVSTCPRWFMQLREEDLLADDGFEGVTVDCIVIAEASVPTLAPAHYIVKMHMPFSDLEDNAPERILPISGQNMCWRRVVCDDGRDINAYLLQKREAPAQSTAANFGFGTAPAPADSVGATSASVNNFGFGFGTAPSDSVGSTGANVNNFGFGFGTAPANSVGATSANVNNFGFGFGTAPANSVGSTGANVNNFGFGFGTAPANSVGSTGANVNNFGFGFGAATSATAPTAAAPVGDFGSQFSASVAPLRPGEVLFALWSKKRLAAMAKSLKSGSRIVRENFAVGPAAPSIKLVMQNDMKDNVCSTVKQLILNKLFAKRCDKITEVDRWIDDCPVYEEHLAGALQKFRANYVQRTAEDSDDFHELYAACHGPMEAELNRIVEIRRGIVQQETACIDAILEEMREGKIAEKQTFRLLKYYAANDVMRFRPFGKVSGISEMGESADVCDPPAPVFVNPFAAARPPLA